MKSLLNIEGLFLTLTTFTLGAVAQSQPTKVEGQSAKGRDSR